MYYLREYISTSRHNYSTRFETRTKEFNWIASRRVYSKTLLINFYFITAKRKQNLCEMYYSTLQHRLIKYILREFILWVYILIFFKMIYQAKEHFSWDPKDGELCSDMVKPGENLVEACVVRNWRANRCRLTWV